MRRPRVEILYFEGCPNHEPALALVERVAAELGMEPEIELVEIPDADSATRHRFLGSPTVRVDGRDVEPGAEERRDYAFSCRIYPGESGFAERPQERWVHDALIESAT